MKLTYSYSFFYALQNIVESDSSNLLQELYDVPNKLTPEDTSVAWMCLVHIKAFKILPPQLYDPSGENCDVVVNKVRKLEAQWNLLWAFASLGGLLLFRSLKTVSCNITIRCICPSIGRPSPFCNQIFWP